MTFPAISRPRRCVVCDRPLHPTVRPRRPTCGDPRCAHEHRLRVWSTPGRRACVFCGATVTAVADVCDDPECRRDRDEERACERERTLRTLEEQKRQDAAKEAFAREHAAKLGRAVPPGAEVLLLPANIRRVTASDPARRAEFAQRLALLASRAAAAPDVYFWDPSPPDEGAPGLTAVSSNACAACLGKCCTSGGTHAYLSEATLARQLRLHPDWTPEQGVEAYLAHVPAEAYEDSCVYHTATGCALPRDMRADMCNRFFCSRLRSFRAAHAVESPGPVLAVLFDEQEWVRTALLGESGVTPLAEPPPAPLES